MSKDASKHTRREFLKYAAMTTAMAGVWHSTAMKTDADDTPPRRTSTRPETNPGPYMYADP